MQLTPRIRESRRIPRRLIFGTVGALSAAILIGVASLSLRTSPAFADVLQAMQSVRTATWVETIIESRSDGEYQRRERICARLNPPALSRTAVDGWKTNGQAGPTPGMITLQDARGMLVHWQKHERWDLLPGWNGPGGGTLNIARQEVLRNLLGPRDATAGSKPIAGTPIETSHWERDTVQQNGHTFLRFHKAYGNQFFGGEEAIWADPETRLIVRREVATRELREGKEQRWRSVAEDFRYNDRALVTSLDLAPPPGTPVQSAGFHFEDRRFGIWDSLSKAQRDQIVRLIDQTVAAWGKGDYPRFAEGWDFDHTGGLPRVNQAGKVIVQTADERQVEWRTRVSRMRSKPVSTKADLQNIIALKDFPPDSLTRDLGFWSLPPEAADLLLVPTVVRCPLAQGSFTAMRGFFYLRRERDGFKVIRWDFGW